MKNRIKPLAASALVAFALVSGCSKKVPDAPVDSTAATASKPGSTDWNDEAGKAAIVADSGAKQAYVCVFIYPDALQRGTNVRAIDRPDLGMKKVSINEESVEATSADRAHSIMLEATNHSLQIGPCTANLANASVDKSLPLSSYVVLQSGLQVGLLYYGLGKSPLPTPDLAHEFDADYQSTTDSFKQQDLIKGIQAKYQAEQQAELASPYFVVKATAALGHYDQQTKSFPVLGLGMDGNSWLNMADSPSYGVVLRGEPRFNSVVPASEDQARALEAKVAASGNNRLPLNVDVYVKAADTLSYAARKDVVAKVVAVHIADTNDSPIADIH
ncbi:hypothetical protein OI25_2951 [Paraburkholderia fungorum]|uniref:Lipoprotein n=1 Tax=Paraburkholderia fungorum TaxID=134537 RepID=A0AAU8SVM8_9BURK|nr:hypothetical protein [Paraburkholderia fungorum]AJZ58021.1 hypothetical protein OI25_2951 [Paraburkholderia fungorum]